MHTYSRTVPCTSITLSGEFPACWCRPSMFCVSARGAFRRVRAPRARDDPRSVRRATPGDRRAAARRACAPRDPTCSNGCSRAFRLWDFSSISPAARENQARRIPWKCLRPSRPRRALDEDTQARARSIVSATSSVYTRRMHDDFLPAHRAAGNDSLRRFMRVVQSVASAGECGFRKPGVRRDIALVPRRPLSAATDLGDVSGHPQVQQSNRGLLAQGGRRRCRLGAVVSRAHREDRRGSRCRRRGSSITSSCSARSTRACSRWKSCGPGTSIPTCYSSGLTRTAYIMIKRTFAPPENACGSSSHARRRCRRRLPKPGRIFRTRRGSIPRSPSSRWTGIAASSKRPWRPRFQLSPTKRCSRSSSRPTTRSSPRWPTTRNGFRTTCCRDRTGTSLSAKRRSGRSLPPTR